MHTSKILVFLSCIAAILSLKIIPMPILNETNFIKEVGCTFDQYLEKGSPKG